MFHIASLPLLGGEWVWWAGWQAVGKQLGSTLECHC